MSRFFIASLLAGLCLVASYAAGVQSDGGQRARELAAIFSKSKHEVKEKRGVRVEKFKEVRSEPAVRQSAADYSGEYVAASVESDYTLSLKVSAEGSVEASGYEPAPGGGRAFTLKDGRVSGALLTGTKVYADGSTEKLEGVFINRTDRDSPSDTGTTEFGLGVLLDPPRVAEGLQMDKLFFSLKR
jgi:hypothetical protein